MRLNPIKKNTSVVLWQMLNKRPSCRAELSQCWQHDCRRGLNIYSNWPTYESDDKQGDVEDFDELLLWAARNTVEFLWQPGIV